MTSYDLTIIGGGVNGTAIARDAAGRGLRVLLLEMHDLASGTSWTSSKLIHGGLRYLEQGAFKLVHEGLAERAALLQTAPHIIWPARFILPHHKKLRPFWQLRAGLFLYDRLGANRILKGTQVRDLTRDVAGVPLQPIFKKALEYSDCCVDDVRLVVLNAIDAAQRGATILTRTRFEKAQRHNGLWHITITKNGQEETIESRALINAAGPWVASVGMAMPADIKRGQVKLVKGSHIIVPQLFTHDKCYIFQNDDGRIVFAIPYQQRFTLIGTTDVAFTGDPATVTASAEEIDYLCALASRYFRQPIRPGDVVASFAGLRPLYDGRSLKAKDLSRDYYLNVDGDQHKAPLLSIYGGKLTAARHLAEDALSRLQPFLPMRAGWTRTSSLPGGDFAWDAFDTLLDNTLQKWTFLTHQQAIRLLRAYGTRITMVLGDAKNRDDLGMMFGNHLTEREVRYLMQHEWAQDADDILWRRSKMALHLNEAEKQKLAAYMKEHKS